MAKKKDKLQMPALTMPAPTAGNPPSLIEARFGGINRDIMKMALELAQAQLSPDRMNSRQRAAALKIRMASFSGIYNAGWLMRYTVHGAHSQRQKAIHDFCEAVAVAFQQSDDKEALLYAIADTLTCGPHGLPWEG